MARPPVLDAPTDTIDRADLAGWTHLAVHCECGKGTVHLPWLLLRRETRFRRFDEVVGHLRCSKCGQRPSRAWLHWQGGQDMQDKRELVLFERECN